MKWCWAAFLVFATAVLPAAPVRNAGPLQKHLVSRLLGMTVESSDGQKLGRVRNFAADMATGEIKYAILSSGGFLGIGSRLKIAPNGALSLATAKRGIVALNTTAFRWKDAPEFKKSELALLNHEDRAEPIYKFYGLSPRLETRLGQSIAGGWVTNLTPTGQEE